MHEDIERDKILTAGEAKEYGIVDEIMQSRKLSAVGSMSTRPGPSPKSDSVKSPGDGLGQVPSDGTDRSPCRDPGTYRHLRRWAPPEATTPDQDWGRHRWHASVTAGTC